MSTPLRVPSGISSPIMYTNETFSPPVLSHETYKNVPIAVLREHLDICKNHLAILYPCKDPVYNVTCDDVYTRASEHIRHDPNFTGTSYMNYYIKLKKTIRTDQYFHEYKNIKYNAYLYKRIYVHDEDDTVVNSDFLIGKIYGLAVSHRHFKLGIITVVYDESSGDLFTPCGTQLSNPLDNLAVVDVRITSEVRTLFPKVSMSLINDEIQKTRNSIKDKN